ncbi:Autophagy-related protein 22 [Ceratocystis platani]|uniref:Autophagy-related protein n=1 Tax=Ceratocystis fimbriata f. sp. platani TaxID=88771 RepID=A0A0F8CPF3_CERFI|nr:Autophagy-related protein 22 [Ceratocystis platani]
MDTYYTTPTDPVQHLMIGLAPLLLILPPLLRLSVTFVSVLLQALVVVSISCTADHGTGRKRMLLAFAALGSISVMGFLFVTSRMYLIGAVLTIISNTSFGASFVLLNSFLPLLVRNHPEVAGLKSGRTDDNSNANSSRRTSSDETPLLSDDSAASVSEITSVEMRLSGQISSTGGWFLLSDAIATTSSTAILFAKTQMHMTTWALGMINVISTVSGVVGAFSWALISRSFGLQPHHTLLACIALFELVPLYGLLGYLPIVQRWGVGGLQQPWEMYPLAGVYGFVLGGLSAYCRSVYGELIPPGSETAFYALYAITDKGSSVFGPAIVGFIIDRSGDIRPAFWFLAAMVGLPAVFMSLVDITRGKHEGERLAVQLDGLKTGYLEGTGTCQGRVTDFRIKIKGPSNPSTQGHGRYQASSFRQNGPLKTHASLDSKFIVEPADEWYAMTRYHHFKMNDTEFRANMFIWVANQEMAVAQSNSDDCDSDNSKPAAPATVPTPDTVKTPSSYGWVGKILEIRAHDDRNVYLRLARMYWPDDLMDCQLIKIDAKSQRVKGRQEYHGRYELIASNHICQWILSMS